jgi:radical SAM superfamily enzyme YgiQ (UPF0313 family)
LEVRHHVTVPRVLLINPSMDVEAGFGEYARLMEPMPCIGLAYLAAACRAAGHEVRVLDVFAEPRPIDEVIAQARAWKPDVVGLTMLTPTAVSTEALGRRIREQVPGTRVVFGNLHASLFANDLLAAGSCDAVVHGEGEERFPRLVEALVNGGDPAAIPGVSYRNGAGVETTADFKPIENLDALPVPAWDLFPWRRYTFLPFVTVAKPCLSLLGTRGCPFRCKFCALGYQGNRVRTRAPQLIVDEIEWLVREFGVRHVGFVDPIFPLSKKHGMAVCQAIQDRRIPGPWWWTSETRVDVIDEEMCRAMRQARCKRILFGVESGVDELLAGVGKNFTRADVQRAVRTSRAAGLEISAFFMLGLPGETAEMTRQTIDFALSLDIDFAKFGITVPLPGSELYDRLVADGKIGGAEWRNFSTFNPNPETLPYIPEGLTGRELQALHRKATWRFYVRPRMIFRHLFVTRSIGLRALFNGARILLTQKLRKRL